MTNLSTIPDTELNRMAAELQGWRFWPTPHRPAPDMPVNEAMLNAWVKPDGERVWEVNYTPASDIAQAMRLLASTKVATEITENSVEFDEDGWTARVQLWRFPPGVLDEILVTAEATRENPEEAQARAICEAWCAAMREQKAREQ